MKNRENHLNFSRIEAKDKFLAKYPHVYYKIGRNRVPSIALILIGMAREN